MAFRQCVVAFTADVEVRIHVRNGADAEMLAASAVTVLATDSGQSVLRDVSRVDKLLERSTVADRIMAFQATWI